LTKASFRRGVSLVESVVVMMIGIVLLFSLWPVATGLLRQQRRLSAEELSVESFPFLYEHLAADFSHAAGVLVEPEIESPSFRLILLPGEPDGAEVRWEFAHSLVRRRMGGEEPSSRRWMLDGTLSLRRDDLSYGRFVLSFERPGEASELLAFRPGRGGGAAP
jgi:type II secretory pathway pseudopilin PulG